LIEREGGKRKGVVTRKNDELIEDELIEREGGKRKGVGEKGRGGNFWRGKGRR
jgi:hypothetical protein